MTKERDFEFELTHRIELTSRVILSATSEEEAEDLMQEMIERRDMGLDKIEVKYPIAWDLASEETDASLKWEETE